MFTKEDYHGYFTAIREKEEAMAASLEKVIPTLSDTALIANINNVLNDEIEHVRLVRELFEFLR